MLQSHTATQQWQSFEMRMRRRRVERCLLRASVALEAGVIEDAREALAEAEQLAPSDPDVQSLREQLARPHPRPVAPPAPPTPSAAEFQIREPAAPVDVPEIAPRSSRRLAIAAALLIPLSAAAGWYATRGTPAVSVPAAVPSAPPAAASETKVPPEPPSVTVAESSITVPVATSPEPAIVTDPVATSGSALNAGPAPAIAPPASPGRSTEMPARARDDTARSNVPPPVSPSVTRGFGSTVPEPAPTETRPPAPLPEPAAPVVSGAEGIAAPDSAVKLAAPPIAAPAPQVPVQPVSNAAPANATRTEEQNIRAVLGRYESAYSRLDAAAAGAVWPGVNQRALANAFDGLSAQSISLGQCDVRVNGNTAQANCTGTARWTPKVGGGSQSAARQWRFDLRNASNGWVITQAVIR